MIATHYRKQSPRIRKFAFFDVFNPRPINSDGNLMLRFASHRASVAADTFAVVYDETKIHCFERFAVRFLLIRKTYVAKDITLFKSMSMIWKFSY
jgi:hypothetical protein